MANVHAIETALRRAAETVPGLVAMAANAEGTLYHGAFGKRDLSTGAEMTEDTIFALASMTKAIASVAAMQLVEQGRLSLDAPIGEVLPALANPQVITGFATDGAPKLRPAVRPVTLRQLLTHSAGYGYPMWNAEIGQYLAHTGLPRAPTNWEEAARMPLLFGTCQRL